MDTHHGMLPAMTRGRGHLLTAEALAELDRHEVVEGELVQKASPSFAHGTAQSAIVGALYGFRGRASASRPGGWWIGTEIEIELAPHEVYLPDIAGWRIERVPEAIEERPVRVTPDWVCELLSPSTADRDQGQKQRTYHRARVRHSWIVDPAERVVSVYRWQESGYVLALRAGAGDIVRAEPFEAVELDVGDILGFRGPG